MIKKAQLQIKNLRVAVDGQAILHGIDLVVNPGEIHAIMGPNGSGKSTLAYSLAGHPAYEIKTKSSVLLNGTELLDKSPDERAQAGLFLAFQYPVEVPGVKVQNFLRLAYEAIAAHDPSKLKFKTALAFRQHLEQLAEKFKVKKSLLKRGLNEGFSGGEKKRLEILQMAVLQPTYAILDETDSGLDIDAIKIVAEGVKKIRDEYKTGIIVITHYQRILDYLQPDTVHVVVKGQIVESGGNELVKKLEKQGYESYQDASSKPQTKR